MAEFVYNRTQRHVDRLKLLQRKGYANLSASEREEYHGSAALGAYNYTDINRVESAVAEIAPLYGLHLTTVTDHTYWTVPTMETDGFDATRYLSNVVAIRDAALARNSTLKFPVLPASMNYLTWETANNIEETLYIAYESGLGDIIVTHDGEGNVTLSGVTATHDGEGNVIMGVRDDLLLYQDTYGDVKLFKGGVITNGSTV